MPTLANQPSAMRGSSHLSYEHSRTMQSPTMTLQSPPFPERIFRKTIGQSKCYNTANTIRLSISNLHRRNQLMILTNQDQSQPSSPKFMRSKAKALGSMRSAIGGGGSSEAYF
jgi:hypothetical protein